LKLVGTKLEEQGQMVSKLIKNSKHFEFLWELMMMRINSASKNYDKMKNGMDVLMQ